MIEYLYLSEDGISIVGQDDTAHRVEEHLKHALGSESSSDNVGYSLWVIMLCNLSCITLAALMLAD